MAFESIPIVNISKINKDIYIKHTEIMIQLTKRLNKEK